MNHYDTYYRSFKLKCIFSFKVTYCQMVEIHTPFASLSSFSRSSLSLDASISIFDVFICLAKSA